MNYKIEAIDVLINDDCILNRYYALIPYKATLISNLQRSGIVSKEECLSLADDFLLQMGLPDVDMVNLFRSFLVMYDVKPQKLREIEKVSSCEEEIKSFHELYLLPGVKEIRARLYYEAGYKFLADIAAVLPEQIIYDTGEVIKQKNLDLKVPLLKEVKTHIAVAKAYTYYQ